MLGQPLPLLTHEAADLLRCTAETVRDWIHEGRLRATRARPRGRLLIDRGDVERILGVQTQPVAPVPQPCDVAQALPMA
jgi:excisionase family DNA binding protein